MRGAFLLPKNYKRQVLYMPNDGLRLDAQDPEYQFIDTGTEALAAQITAEYESLTGAAVQPASPEKLLIQWLASILSHERVLNNYTGNQNIPSRAEGENLDALAQLFYARQRPQAQPAVCTQRFYISAAQQTAVLVPQGTRVTGVGGLVWQTVADVYISIGQTYADVQARCQTPGTVGNGLALGQINTAIDLYDYYSKTENVTVSGGGADEATDEEFYQLMRQSMDAYSCAGARGSYEYFAKQVSTEIVDVAANSPTPGVVKLYVLMEGGQLAGTEVKAAVLAACSADEVRPLTDQVFVEDAETVTYNINFTYYLQNGRAKSAAEVEAAVHKAVEEYAAWQCGRLGRDVNPDVLREYLYHTGVKRIVLTSPVFTALRDDGKTAPQVAKLGAVAITSGGYEDE